VSVGGRRVRTVDVHAHCAVPAGLGLVSGTRFEERAKRQLGGHLGFSGKPRRGAGIDRGGIRGEAPTSHAFWSASGPRLGRPTFDLQSEKLAAMCKAIPGRFLGYAPVSLQFPELAAEQLQHGMKDLGFVGAAIGGSVEGEEIAAPRFDPFWKKAEELQALI